jgi:F0F1-type ATP synthase membrane subunit c/vacuolar-type H+-ATPase subunit K
MKLFQKVLFLFLFFFILTSVDVVTAQTNAISITVEVSDVPQGSEPNGLIVTIDKGTYKLSSKKADPNLIGVITNNPSITLRKSTNPNVYDINNTGVTLVRASNSSGKITKGDYVTSSDKLGIAVRSVDSEYVLGTALEDFDSADGLMRITVEPHYVLFNVSTGTNLLNVVRSSSQSAFLAPVDSLRYLLAAIVAIASFLFGFSIFGKITGSGIQALARNPLARSSIQINIIIEFILNIGIIVFGIVVSYFILTL